MAPGNLRRGLILTTRRLKYGFQCTMNPRNLRKKWFFTFRPGASMFRRGDYSSLALSWRHHCLSGYHGQLSWIDCGLQYVGIPSIQQVLLYALHVAFMKIQTKRIEVTHGRTCKNCISLAAFSSLICWWILEVRHPSGFNIRIPGRASDYKALMLVTKWATIYSYNWVHTSYVPSVA